MPRRTRTGSVSLSHRIIRPMKASVAWLNQYLDPGDLSAEQIDHALTHAGFPIDSREPLPDGDTRLEVEVTSNRGDCLAHIGLAREIAAKTGGGRLLKLPAIKEPRAAGNVRDVLALENQVPDACPRFTLQVVRGIKIAPSPPWLARALQAVGQRPINNVVDATNFLNFEFGQPCHAFDLARLAGERVVIRRARAGETLTTLDGKRRTLHPEDVVVADAQRAQSLAGVIGGQDSEVTASSTDIALEVATWDPQTVRRTARRHQVRTDACHRFERYVDPRTLEGPAERLLSLVAELTGGTPCQGMLDAFPAGAAPLTEVGLRLARIPLLLGIDVPDDEVANILRAVHIECDLGGSDSAPVLTCRIPPHRPDLTREVDLIEEIARLRGFEAIPAHDRIAVQVRPPQTHEEASRVLGETLAALGFLETVTVSFITEQQAKPFLAAGLGLLGVHDERRANESTLRPSLLPSLLACRKANQDRGASVAGGIRLFETAATYAEEADEGAIGSTLERRVLALTMDIPNVGKGKPGSLEDRQHGIRVLRGAIETAAHALGGAPASIELRPAPPALTAFDPSAHAEVLLNGRPIGRLGLVSAQTQRLFDLDFPQAAAEVELEPLLVLYPPRSGAAELPHFPAVERDLSLVVPDATPWSQVRELILASRPPLLDHLEFIGTYRGPQTGPGKKSLTLRLRFRDPKRTLRHEEVDPQVRSVVDVASQKLGATLRA